MPIRLVGRILLGTGFWAAVGAGWVTMMGAASSVRANERSRTALYPPLRNAQQKASWLGSSAASDSSANPPTHPIAATPPASISTVPNAGSATGGAIVPDSKWCGIEASASPMDSAMPCKLTTLPCGPIGADRILNNSGEDTDDLDGDGQRDLVVGGRLSVNSKEIFAAIYRGSDSGYVLSDYRVVPARAEPTYASVLLTENGKPPLLRDGHDLVESNGRSHSHARLRRFDGQRFRTLLTFCAHRSEPSSSAPGGARQGMNRVDFIDVDKDGSKEVVIQGLLAPTVFRFSDGGQTLIEDRGLTRTFRETSPEAVRARGLRAEAERLLDQGEVRRAAELYQRAFLSASFDIDLGLAAAEAQVRSGQPDRALEMVTRLRYQDPDRGSTACTMAAVQRALRNTLAEAAALRSCVEKEKDETRRNQAQNRLRELSGQSAPPPPPAPSASPTQQSIVDEALGTP